MKTDLDLLLVVMPFASVREPPIGPSLLKAAAVRAGFAARVRHFQLDFAAKVGLDSYERIPWSFASRSLAGDWIFARAAFGADTPIEQGYFEHLFEDYARWEDGVYYGVDFGEGRGYIDHLRETLVPFLQTLRQQAAPFVDRCVDEIRSLNPRVVGFSSSCHQACSCLAVARRLGEMPDPPLILVGGANCHGDMGLQWLRSFPWIDAVCTGEGDEALPLFLQSLLRGRSATPVPGILRRGDQPEGFVVPRVEDLDALPFPDYSDYFAQLPRALRKESPAPVLPLETSRGCWWGEKRQCVFCGDLPGLLPFRSKSPQRVVDELQTLTSAFPFESVQCVDDVMDASFPSTLFPALAALPTTTPITFQVRPGLRRDELVALREGGVTCIQPGIESLSDAVLRLIRKGSTRLQNIQLLRWCSELEIEVFWNMLYGFPGEEAAEYERIAGLIPSLVHLPPPVGCTWIALKRFSPHWRQAGRFGLTDVRPWPSYRHVFPLPNDEIRGMAFFFDHGYADGRDPFDYSRPLRRVVGVWLALWENRLEDRPRLQATLHGDEVTVQDTRPCAVASEHRLSGLPARLLVLCDRARGIADLRRRCRLWDAAAVGEALAALVDARLIVVSKDRFLSLPLLR